MEKRISFFEFQSVKSVAKAIEPKLREKSKIVAQMEKLAAEYKKCEADIEAYEAGIVNVIGFHVADLVQKVVETTTNKEGKEVKLTKYLPTDKVHYDDTTKEYVITDEVVTTTQQEADHKEENTKVEVPSAGNDFDANGDMPFSAPADNEQEVF